MQQRETEPCHSPPHCQEGILHAGITPTPLRRWREPPAGWPRFASGVRELTLWLRSGQALGYVQTSLHFPGLSALNVVMPTGLRRFQLSGQSHFVTFTCYHRRAYFDLPDVCDLFVQCLESMRCRFPMCVYGYVVMPEHVHLLLNEPSRECWRMYRVGMDGERSRDSGQRGNCEGVSVPRLARTTRSRTWATGPIRWSAANFAIAAP